MWVPATDVVRSDFGSSLINQPPTLSTKHELETSKIRCEFGDVSSRSILSMLLVHSRQVPPNTTGVYLADLLLGLLLFPGAEDVEFHICFNLV